MKADQANRFKQIKQENARLKCLLAEAELEQGDSTRGSPGKLLSPTRRRATVEHVRRELKVSERRACHVLEQARAVQRYTAQVRDDEDA